jgi:hypothetical protein
MWRIALAGLVNPWSANSIETDLPRTVPNRRSWASRGGLVFDFVNRSVSPLM